MELSGKVGILHPILPRLVAGWGRVKNEMTSFKWVPHKSFPLSYGKSPIYPSLPIFLNSSGGIK